MIPAVLDFHSHVLPQIDDGSRSVDESLAMLQLLSEQGVDLVAATPHFYPERHTLDRFLEKREEAYGRLTAELQLREEQSLRVPSIRLGAEVWYYRGISRLEGLERLRLEGTNLLLLEMPMEPWSRSMVQEILDLNCSGVLTVVLAHIERYLAYQDTDVWESLLQNGVLFQVNASFFLMRRTRGRALKMLKHGQIQWIGSDSHNLSERPPRMGPAVAVIRRKLGDAFLADFDAQNRSYWK